MRCWKVPQCECRESARVSASLAGSLTSARFFDKYQDRILFGTDVIPLGTETPQQVFGEDLYGFIIASSKPRTRYFDYAPAPCRRRADGDLRSRLAEEILRKVYYQNAERVPPVEAGGGVGAIANRDHAHLR